MQIRDILNQILWDPHFQRIKQEFFIQYIHRGVPGDILIIPCMILEKVRSDSFEYWNDIIKETIRIPFHRIEKIFNQRTNEILYKKRQSGDTPGNKSV